MLQFSVEVVLPAAVDGGEGDSVGMKFIDQVHSCAVKGEGVVRDDDSVRSRNKDEQGAREWETGLHSLLIEANENDRGWTEKPERVAVIDGVRGSGGQYQKDEIRGGER